MTIKNLLLGSAAVLALGTSAQAADPIAVALDTCDLLNITGLTISSESNCLKIEGDVSYEWSWTNNAAGVNSTVSDLDWMLKFTATADSDFGPTMAVIELREAADKTITAANSTHAVINEAYVAIGDSSATVFYAGKKGSVANTGDDETFTAIYSLDLDGNDEGIALTGNKGGYVLQVSSSLGDGVTAAVGLEDLGRVSGEASLVGALGVSQDWGTAHASFVYDDLIAAANAWSFHTGATFNVDDMSFRAAFSTDSASAWTALITAKATMDMFTLAAGAEFRPANVWEAAVSGVAAVNDATTITVAARFDNASNWDLALKGAFKVSDTLTATAKVNFDESSVTAFEGDLDWAPGGGATVNVGFNIDSNNVSKVSTKFKKTFN